jgi:hypothetical protein
MGIFSKKTVVAETKVVKVNAETIGLEIDKLTKSFTTIVTKLNTQAQAAKELKAAKEAEIAALQAECTNLEAVGTRAANIADKIAGLFN